MPDPTVYDVFDQLDKWRHLPKYQLERRADIYFAMFLPEVLGRRFGAQINPLIVPEFPLKKDGSFASTNVDYFALSKECDQLFLVELKTDLRSLEKEQDDYLKKAMEKNLKSLVDDIICISSSPKAPRRKYIHLLNQLSSLGLVEVPDDLYKKAYPRDKKTLTPQEKGSLTRALRDGVKSKVKNAGLKPRIVYVQPHEDSSTRRDYACYIYFEEFASVVKDSGELGKWFAQSLERWAKEKAGSVRPDGA